MRTKSLLKVVLLLIMFGMFSWFSLAHAVPQAITDLIQIDLSSVPAQLSGGKSPDQVFWYDFKDLGIDYNTILKDLNAAGFINADSVVQKKKLEAVLEKDFNLGAGYNADQNKIIYQRLTIAPIVLSGTAYGGYVSPWEAKISSIEISITGPDGKVSKFTIDNPYSIPQAGNLQKYTKAGNSPIYFQDGGAMPNTFIYNWNCNDWRTKIPGKYTIKIEAFAKFYSNTYPKGIGSSVDSHDQKEVELKVVDESPFYDSKFPSAGFFKDFGGVNKKKIDKFYGPKVWPIHFSGWVQAQGNPNITLKSLKFYIDDQLGSKDLPTFSFKNQIDKTDYTTKIYHWKINTPLLFFNPKNGSQYKFAIKAIDSENKEQQYDYNDPSDLYPKEVAIIYDKFDNLKKEILKPVIKFFWDSQPPETKVSKEIKDEMYNGWLTKKESFQLEANDPGKNPSGVDKTEFYYWYWPSTEKAKDKKMYQPGQMESNGSSRSDIGRGADPGRGGTSKPNDVVMGEDGFYDLWYRSNDIVKNYEEWKHELIKIDKGSPTCFLVFPIDGKNYNANLLGTYSGIDLNGKPYNVSAPLKVNVQSTLSGVNKMEYSIMNKAGKYLAKDIVYGGQWNEPAWKGTYSFNSDTETWFPLVFNGGQEYITSLPLVQMLEAGEKEIGKYTLKARVTANNGKFAGNSLSFEFYKKAPAKPSLDPNPKKVVQQNNDGSVKIAWTNPDHPAEITKAWYQIYSEAALWTAPISVPIKSSSPSLNLNKIANDQTKIRLWLEDEFGNVDPSSFVNIDLDTTPPEVKITAPNPEKLYLDKLPLIEVEAKDAGSPQSGLSNKIALCIVDTSINGKKLYWSFDIQKGGQGQWLEKETWIDWYVKKDSKWQYTYTDKMFANGHAYTIRAKAYDNANNVSVGMAETAFVLDNSPPMTTVSVGGNTIANKAVQAKLWFNKAITLNLNANDTSDTVPAGSGVKQIYYKLTHYKGNFNEVITSDEKTVTGKNVPLSLDGDGAYSVLFKAMDNLGQEETLVSLNFEIDKQKPEISIAKPETSGVYSVLDGIYVNAKESDPDTIGAIVSGLKEVKVHLIKSLATGGYEYYQGAGQWLSKTESNYKDSDYTDSTWAQAYYVSNDTYVLPLLQLKDGQYQVLAVTFDNAGNLTKSSKQGFSINTVPIAAKDNLLIDVIPEWGNTDTTYKFNFNWKKGEPANLKQYHYAVNQPTGFWAQTVSGSTLNIKASVMKDLSEGANNLLFLAAESKAGVLSDTVTINFRYDKTPPAAPKSLNIDPEKWTPKKEWKIWFSDPDDTSGVIKAYYKVDGEAYLPIAITKTENGDNFIIKPSVTEGVHKVTFYLEDKAKNADPTKAGVVELKFDETPPLNPTVIKLYSDKSKAQSIFNGAISLSSKATGNYKSPYFEWEGASDKTSLVAGYYVYFGENESADPAKDGKPQEGKNYYEVVEPLESGKTYYLMVKAVDNAMLSSDAKTLFTYTYNNTPPATTAAVTYPVAPPSVDGWFNKAINIKLEAASAVSKITSISYTIDGGAPVVYPSSSLVSKLTTTVNLAEDGTHTLEYWSDDNIGQSEFPHNTLSVKIDKGVPEVKGIEQPVEGNTYLSFLPVMASVQEGVADKVGAEVSGIKWMKARIRNKNSVSGYDFYTVGNKSVNQDSSSYGNKQYADPVWLPMEYDLLNFKGTLKYVPQPLQKTIYTLTIAVSDKADNVTTKDIIITVDPTIMKTSAPTGLTISKDTVSGNLKLEWSEPVSKSGTISYNLYRSQKAFDFNGAEQIKAKYENTVYKGEALPTQSYYYTVKAVNEAGESGGSNVAGAYVTNLVAGYNWTAIPLELQAVVKASALANEFSLEVIKPKSDGTLGSAGSYPTGSDFSVESYKCYQVKSVKGGIMRVLGGIPETEKGKESLVIGFNWIYVPLNAKYAITNAKELWQKLNLVSGDQIAKADQQGGGAINAIYDGTPFSQSFKLFPGEVVSVKTGKTILAWPAD